MAIPFKVWNSKYHGACLVAIQKTASDTFDRLGAD